MLENSVWVIGLKCPRCNIDMLIIKKIVSRFGYKYILFYLCPRCRKIWKLSFKEVDDERDIYG